eukprot:3089854-Amphidinium_carterae.2
MMVVVMDMMREQVEMKFSGLVFDDAHELEVVETRANAKLKPITRGQVTQPKSHDRKYGHGEPKETTGTPKNHGS